MGTKLSLLSDLHLEFDEFFRPKNTQNSDILLLAGDIAIFKYLKPNSGRRDMFMPFFEHISKEWETILYIPGNHEYYGHSDISSNIIQEVGYELPDNIILANNDVYFHDDLAVVMGTMWTDINKGNPSDVFLYQTSLNDSKQIKDSRGPGYRWVGNGVLREHMITKNYFDSIINNYPDKKVVCMTHHAPSQLSEHPRYKGDRVNCYYNSDLTSMMQDNVKLWVHGHTHDNFDYTVGNTRVVANPKGYRNENPNFDPNFVLTL